MGNSDLSINVKINPKVDSAELKNQINSFGAIDLSATIDLDLNEFEKAVADAEDKFESLANDFDKGLSLNIDPSKAENALANIEESLGSAGEKIGSINIDELAASFDNARNETVKLLDVQNKALAQMKLNGEEGSDSYKDLQQAIKLTSDRVKEFDDATNNVDPNSVEGLAAAYTKAKTATTQLLDSQEKALKQMKINGSEGSEAYLDLENAIKHTSDKMKQFEDVVEALDPNSIEGLANAYESAKSETAKLLDMQEKALKQMKITGSEGSEAYKDLEVLITENTEKMKAFGNETAKAPESFMDKFAKFKAIGELGNMIAEFGEKGAEVNTAMREIAAQTGATGEALAELKTTAESAFKQGVGESVADAIKIMGTAKQTLGKFLDPQGLNDFTTAAAGIAKVFGGDVNEVLIKSRTFVTNFGLEGKKAGELMSLLYQHTGAPDAMDTLEEYSQLVAKAGFSAEEFIGTMNNGFDNNTRNLDKLGDSIKETQIRLSAGDTSKAVKDITSPISAEMNAIVNLAQSGKISVKELMQKTSSLLAESASDGKITAAIRDQYTTALSGTMAEDIGGETWTKIFSAPIDTATIEAQAKLAGDTVTKALGPMTFVGKAQKEIALLTTKASEFLAPIAGYVGGAMSTISSIAPGLSLITDNFDSIQKYGGKAFGFVKDSVGTAFTSIKGAFLSGEVSATAFWSAATVGVALAIPALIALYENFEPFTKLVDGLAVAVKDGFNLVVNYVSAFASNAMPILKALAVYAVESLNPVNWITDSGAEARKKAGDQLNATIAGAMKDAQRGIDKEGLSGAISDAVTIKGDMDKNGKLKDLIDKFKNAKTEAQKNSLAEAIQAQVPGVATGVTDIIDEHGKVKQAFQINIDKAAEFQAAQEKSLSGGQSENSKKFRAGILALSDDYDKAKAKMEELQAQSLKNPGDVGLRESFNKAKKEVEDTGNKLGTTVAQGRKLGLVTGDANNMTKELGLSGDKAKYVAINIKSAETNSKAAAAAIKDIGVAFNEAKADADKALQSMKDKLGALYYKKSHGGLTEDEQKDLKKLGAEAKKAQKDAEGYGDTIDKINKVILPDKATREAASVKNKQDAYDLDKKTWEGNDKFIDHERKLALLEEGRSQTTADQLKYAQDDLVLLVKKLQALENITGVTKEQKEAFKKDADGIRDSIEQKKWAIEELQLQVKSVNFEFDKKVFDHILKQTQFDIELGIKDESALIPLFTKEFERIDAEKKRLNEKLLKADEATKNDLLAKIFDLDAQEIELSKSKIDAQNKLTDRNLKKKLDSYATDSVELEKKLTEEKSFFDIYYNELSDMGKSARDEDLSRRLDNLDAISQYEQSQVGDNEEAKKRIADKYETQKQEAQKKAAKIAATQDALIAGDKIAFENEQADKRNALIIKQKEAEAQALADKGDYTGAGKLIEEFQAMEKVIADRKDPLANSINELKAGIDPFMNSLFEGNEQGMKDAARKTLANTVTYLKRLLTAYVVEIVLKSPTIKALAAAAGPLAPLVTGAAAMTITAGMNAIMNPLFSSILAFPTGASPEMLNQPTILAGDGGRLGGENREWIFRNDQLNQLMEEILNRFVNMMAGYFNSLIAAFSEQRIVGVVAGDQINLVAARAEYNTNQRVRIG